jgi:hypothetical protein
MNRFVLALLLVSAPAYASEEQINAAFRTAFGVKKDEAVLKKQGPQKETIKYTPGDLIGAPFGLVLLSSGEVDQATHANKGKLAIFYLTQSGKTYTVSKKFVPAVETGTFGKIVDWSVSKSFGDLPILTVNGASNWQGLQCSTVTMVELQPDGPKTLATVPMTYDNSGAGGSDVSRSSGRIENIKPGKGFDVVYIGTKKFTDHYVRDGNAYVLADGSKSRMQTC